ncbi:hypothetical protein HDZ31DRAFT_66583 [Schizophyllum fasciatum]
MPSQKARQFVKDTLSFSRVRVIYARITLTRYTTLFFFFALLSALVLLALEAVAYNDNSMAIDHLDGIIAQGNTTNGIFLQKGNMIQVCYDVPGHTGSMCRPLWQPDHKDKDHDKRAALQFDDIVFDTLAVDDGNDAHGVWATVENPMVAATVERVLDSGKKVRLDTACVESLEWLSDTLKDSRREDFATGAFHIWLFSVAAVTILNESLPHLLASGVSHVLATAWAGYRIHQTIDIRSIYYRLISADDGGACGDVDMLGPWWDMRIQHAIPIVIFNALSLLWFVALSLQLFRVYKHQSFSRVGASPQIHKVYKIVLSLSVALQLALFFTLVTTAIWIDKIARGNIRRIAFHSKIYKAAFIITAIVELPWIVLGWISVRRECRIMYCFFALISAILLGISTALFCSPLYRYVLTTWPFFASMSVMSYILVLTTSVLGVIARMHFGRGLKHYLEVSDALEDVDFTPVYFSNDPKKQSLVSVDLPNLGYASEKPRRSSIDKRAIPDADAKGYHFEYPPPPEPAAKVPHAETASLYSRAPSTPRKLTVTPRFLRESYQSKVSSSMRDSLVSRISSKTSVAVKAKVSQVSLVSTSRASSPSSPHLASPPQRTSSAHRASTSSTSSADSDDSGTIASWSAGRSSIAKSTVSTGTAMLSRGTALPAEPVPAVPPMGARKVGLPGNPRPLMRGGSATGSLARSGSVDTGPATSRSPPKAGFF